MVNKMSRYWNEDFLEHHGIYGQHWGERNGPPYPLDYSAHNSVEKQGLSETRSSAGSFSRKKTASPTKTIDNLVKKGKASLTKIPDYTVGYTLFSNKNYSNGQQFVSGLTNADDWNFLEVSQNDSDGEWRPAAYNIAMQNPTGKRSSTVSDDMMSNCNPHYGEPGTTQNCAKDSACLEMMMRGFKCNAGRQQWPSTDDAEEVWFKDAKPVAFDDADNAEDGLRSYGKGTSGTISIGYATGGGHCMHWTNDDEGNFEIQDGQDDMRFDSVASMMSKYGADASKGIRTYRLDNCEPNWDAMASDGVLSERGNYEGGDALNNHMVNRITGKHYKTF